MRPAQNSVNIFQNSFVHHLEEKFLRLMPLQSYYLKKVAFLLKILDTPKMYLSWGDIYLFGI